MGAVFFLICVLSCHKNEAPVAIFEISPKLGHYSQKFSFDASSSSDLEYRDHELEIRWDFDGDSHWDNDWSYNKIVTHYYPERGTYIAVMQIRNPKEETVETKRQANVSLLNLKAVMVDARDGKDYNTVLIDSIWWIAEDLHHGKWISMWEKALQLNNGIVERYGRTDFNDLDEKTGYYIYGEAMDYTYGEKTPGICPPGWYIPSNEEWISLVEHIDDGKDPAIFLSILGDEGVNLGFGGRRYIGWGQTAVQPGGLYWTSSGFYESEPYSYNIFFFPKDTSYLRPITFEPGDTLFSLYYKKYALPLRCVKKNIR